VAAVVIWGTVANFLFSVQIQSDRLETVAVVPGVCIFVPFLLVMLVFGRICFSSYCVQTW